MVDIQERVAPLPATAAAQKFQDLLQHQLHSGQLEACGPRQDAFCYSLRAWHKLLDPQKTAGALAVRVTSQVMELIGTPGFQVADLMKLDEPSAGDLRSRAVYAGLRTDSNGLVGGHYAGLSKDHFGVAARIGTHNNGGTRSDQNSYHQTFSRDNDLNMNFRLLAIIPNDGDPIGELELQFITMLRCFLKYDKKNKKNKSYAKFKYQSEMSIRMVG